ncbi:TspO/MBR family protein [Halococcoides cellulosivorans]|uniref:TspO protein n=1 Tax=Halococcoides cellulosivorans TaxID=1679096 RepID=A0A2R4X1L0_9EURY|nr:TspO/MBR family protein [Halococcoides cellulosivorans]AWB27687.1 TspO protein [Halococcoides cellulosivorans]
MSTETEDGLARTSPLARTRPIATLIAAVLAVELVGASGAVFTTGGLDWYATLQRPPIAPPNWVFGPVWTLLFAGMGIAVWLVWRQRHEASPVGGLADRALALFAIHMVVNVAWSGAFFGLQSTAIGLAVIVVLWALIFATMVAFYRIDWRASALLGPYLAWVSFASVLNAWLWLLN